MADNIKKRTFEIEITGVKESVTSLTTLEKVLERMEKTVESINSKGGFSIVSKEANKNTKEAIDLAKAEEIAQGKVISSYKDKQTAMRALGKEIKNMTVADGEAAKKQQEMISQYNDLNNQLKSFDASMGNHQRNVGNYSSALKDAKEELKEIKAQMVGLDQFSAEYAELAKRGGEVADKMGDINEAIKRQASDTKGLDAVIDYAKSATAAFTLYKGAMSAFGVETKETEKAMQQLLRAMSMIQSLQQLSESFQSTTATGKLLHKTHQMVGLESKTAAASTTALISSLVELYLARS
jgi:archaellum component FlaC